MILIKFLFFFFFVFLILLGLMGFSLFRGVKRAFTGGGKQQQTYRNNQTKSNAHNRRSYNTLSSGDSQSYAEEVYEEPRYRRHKKVYGHDEGEYVDYEEVKE